MSIISKNFSITLFFFSLFLFLIPQDVHGWIFDLAIKSVASVSEFAGPMIALFVFSFAFFVIGYIVLIIGSSLLQGIISITPVLLTVTTGDGVANFIRLGWNFTSGIVNLLLIIAFVAIAFAVIVGSDKIDVKKALPRLIIVALLVNFTLFFMGVAIDISNILYNSIAFQFLAGEGENIFRAPIAALLRFSDMQMGITSAYLALLMISAVIPYVSTVAIIGFILGWSHILATISQFFTYGGISFLLGVLFFLFFLVFLIRIFVIQILAVFAPLAFFCLIFDQTKRYWDMWLKYFLEWLLVGVIFIFLIYFGLLMAPAVGILAGTFSDYFIPSDTPDIAAWWFEGIREIISSIFLLIYFIVIAGVTKKFVPAAVQAAITQTGSLIKMAMPYAGAMASGGIKRYVNKALKGRNEADKRIEEDKTEKPGLLRRFDTGFLRAHHWAVRGAHKLAGKNMEQEAEKEIAPIAEEMEKEHGKDYKGAVEKWRGLIRKLVMTDAQKVAFLRYLEKGGAKALSNLKEEELLKLLEIAGARGDLKTVKDIIKHVPNLIDTTKSSDPIKAAEIQRVLGLENNEDVYKMAVQRIKTEDINSLSEETVKDKDFLRAACLYRGIDFIRKLGERSEDGPQVMEQLKKIIHTEDGGIFEKMKRENSTLYTQIEKNVAYRDMLGFKEKIEQEREKEKKEREREVKKKKEREEAKTRLKMLKPDLSEEELNEMTK